MSVTIPATRPRRQPTHPGEILRQDVLPALDLWRAKRALRQEHKHIPTLEEAA